MKHQDVNTFIDDIFYFLKQAIEGKVDITYMQLTAAVKIIEPILQDVWLKENPHKEEQTNTETNKEESIH